MKILHTSDWHLGRSFHGVGLLDAQAAYVDHVLDVVASEQVDLVVVSGDIYDRGLPPVDAVAVFHDALSRLAASRARVVITSGNHDSAQRLGFASGLIDTAGIHLRTNAADVATPVVLNDSEGPVAVYGIPYLDPDVMRRAWDLGSRSHEAALSEAMRRIRTDLSGRGGTRSIVMAHAFVAGGQPSDSERDIAVGGVSRIPTGIFDGIDYAALGHLHGQQVLSERVRYCGSPLAYSFSEAGHVKGSWLVDLRADSIHTDFVAAPVACSLVRLRGELAELLVDPELSHAERSWVQVTLTDAVRPRFPMDQLRSRFPHTLSLLFDPVGASQPAHRRSTKGRSDLEVVTDFVEHVRGGPASDAELALLRDAVESCCGVPEADSLVGS